MTDLPPFDQMHREWTAWTQGVVREFSDLGIDINENQYDALARSIELWGEELACLRQEQPGDVCLTALMEKRARYESVRA